MNELSLLVTHILHICQKPTWT